MSRLEEDVWLFVLAFSLGALVVIVLGLHF